MSTGRWRHWPAAGGFLDQPLWLLEAVRNAWRVWFINEYKMANNLPVAEEDDDFMRWVHDA